ncbi:MAG: D-2-hydroxyacid dehydrogenase [Bacteroidaceae bacterium]|nr:D-2-hydroxyacid dehydrogenase [Bacteroidaceae bacterium]
MNIVVLDKYAANPGDIPTDELEALGNCTFHDFTEPEEVVERLKDADAALTNKVCITAEIMDRLPRLRYIGVQATGYNVIDIDAAHKRNITVTNVPAYSTDSVAQITFAHLLNVCNAVGHYAQDIKQGAWTEKRCFCYWDTPLIELAGRQLGIIGYGNIGKKVAEIAKAFGMIVAHASARKNATIENDATALDELLATSDIVSLHCPASKDTMGFVNAEFIAKMKQGAILINTARGQLINEGDVAEALHSGKLAAYCTDTLVHEPALPDNPLLAAPNAFITPHNAWATLAARKRLLHTVAENLKAFKEGKPQNAV